MKSKKHKKNDKLQQVNKEISMEDIEVVQNLIERCIQDGMNKREIINFLSAKFEPRLICTVWDKLKSGNEEFFKAYYANHYLKDQILRYTDLLSQHVEQVRLVNFQPRNLSIICPDNNRFDVAATSSSAMNNIQNHTVPSASQSLNNFGASNRHQGNGFLTDFTNAVNNFPDIYTKNHVVSYGSHDLTGSFDPSNSELVNGLTAFEEDDSFKLNFENNDIVNNELLYEHNSIQNHTVPNGVHDLSHFDTANSSLVNGFTAPEDNFYELGSENKYDCPRVGMAWNELVKDIADVQPEHNSQQIHCP